MPNAEADSMAVPDSVNLKTLFMFPSPSNAPGRRASLLGHRRFLALIDPRNRRAPPNPLF
jgi:hypothetical protein